MIILPIRVSLATHPSFMSYAPRLSWGWIHRLLGWVPGAVGERISSGQTFIPLYVDNSDAQYRGFRNNLWVLTIFVGSWISLKHGIIYATSQTRGTVDPIQRNLILAIISLFVLHGSSAIKVILLCAASCGLALVKWERWWMRPMVVWTFNALVLWTNDRWDGYKYGDLGGEAWAFLVSSRSTLLCSQVELADGQRCGVGRMERRIPSVGRVVQYHDAEAYCVRDGLSLGLGLLFAYYLTFLSRSRPAVRTTTHEETLPPPTVVHTPHSPRLRALHAPLYRGSDYGV